MNKINFKSGIIDGIPIALGYLAVSFGFGIMAVTSGLLWYEALFISMFNLTSAGQLAAVDVFAVGGSLAELAATQLTINSRYALMSVSLSQRLDKNVRMRDRLIIGFANTDEIFAVACGKTDALSREYLFGLAALPYIGWSTGTLLGALAGAVLPELIVTALSVSLYAMFIAIIVPDAKKETKVLLSVLTAVALSCMFTYVPVLKEISSGFSIVICSVLISGLFAIICPIDDGEVSHND
jgi:4-azaleucine resistance transporter AzlC